MHTTHFHFHICVLHVDSLFEVCWAGKAYFIGSAVLGMLFTWYMQLFSEPAEGTLLQSWCNGQANLRRLFTGIGVICLFSRYVA
jgi:hypothetical protein